MIVESSEAELALVTCDRTSYRDWQPWFDLGLDKSFTQCQFAPGPEYHKQYYRVTSL